MRGYLTKPINPVELFGMVESIIKNQDYNKKKKTRKIDYNEVLDVEEGIMRLINNVEAYFKILRNFNSEYKNIYKELVECLEMKDYVAFNMRIHSLKGSTANISANKIFRFLASTNNLNDESNYKQIQSFLDELKSDLEELFITIDYNINLREPTEIIARATEKFEFSNDEIKQRLKELIDLLEYDYGLVEVKFRELDQTIRNSRYQNRWEELEKYINTFDVDRAILVIENILQLLKEDND
jgi:HPt (histidine-containing phosphotransfer) domain-containing protein